MNKRTLFAGMLFAAVLFSGCGDGVADSSDMSEASRGEISGVVSAEKDISGNEEVSREPEESEKANVSDGGASENTDVSREGDASATEEVFEIDGCYYLNPEGATEAVTGDPVTIEFSDFESMAAFMQKKEYSKAELKDMARLFSKDEHGIRLGDVNRVLFPIANGFEVDCCAWLGTDHFWYCMEHGDKVTEFHVWGQANQLNEHREYMNDTFRYERLVMNPRTFNHKLTKEVKDGIEYFDVEYETSSHYQRKGYFDFVKDGVSYNVYITYSSAAKSEGKKSSDESLNEIMYIHIIATGEKAEWIGTLIRHDESAINPDYIASFGWKEIDLTK